MKEKIRRFKTGATRSDDTGRIDPEAALSPLVLNEYCEHIKAHRLQPDGSIRADDNWQKGFSFESCAKGLNRHHLHFWLRHRGFPVKDVKAEPNIKRDLCASIFNAQVYLHQLLKAEIEAERKKKNVADR